MPNTADIDLLFFGYESRLDSFKTICARKLQFNYTEAQLRSTKDDRRCLRAPIFFSRPHIAVAIGLSYWIELFRQSLKEIKMPTLGKTNSSPAAEIFEYPTGMVWCPMKMSGMAVMRCARLQKELGCGTRRELQTLKTTKPERFVFVWPWLRRRSECPARATEKQIREVLLAITSLKLVERSRKNPRAYRCTGCGGRKTFSARRCRQCWLVSMGRNQDLRRV